MSRYNEDFDYGDDQNDYGERSYRSPAASSREPCPMCGEMIVVGARICRFCGESVDGGGYGPRHPRKEVDSEMVRKFRREIHGLGGFWIFIGGVSLAVVAYIATTNKPLPQIPAGRAFLAIIGILSFVWLIIGVLACCKQMWAVYTGLVLSYLSIIGNLIGLNVCGIIILILVVIQAHRTISWAGKMRRAGVPLTAKPEEFR